MVRRVERNRAGEAEVGGFNLADWSNMVGIAAGSFAIIAGAYAFFQWFKNRRKAEKNNPLPGEQREDPTAPSKPEPSFQVTLIRNPQLCHAQPWLGKIEKAFSGPGSAARRVVIQGQGGIGKTAMALEYAYRQADDYPGGVYWLPAESGLGPAVMELAGRMEEDGLDCGIREGRSEKEAVRCFLGFLKGRGRSLIVLDNVEDPALAERFNPREADLILTTRLTELPYPLIAMDLPQESQALDIFLAYAGKERAELSGSELEQAGYICQKAGELPYALELLGILARGEGLVNLAGRLDRIADLSTKTRLPISQVLALAGQEFDHPGAGEALPFLGYLDPDDLTARVLALAMETEEDEAARILSSLARLSVVKAKAEGGYTIHRLTQEAARAEDQGSLVGSRTARAVTAFIDGVTKSSAYKQGYFLIPHLVHLAGMAAQKSGPEEFPEIGQVDSWANFFWQSGFYEYSERLNRTTLARIQNHKGAEHPDCGDRLNDIAVTVREQGRYEEAEELFRQALALGEKTMGTEHPDYAVRLNNLATVYKFQKKYGEAEELYRKALEITAKTTGEASPEYAIRLNNLAGVISDRGDHQEAEELYRKAMEIDEKTIGEKHPQYALRLNNLAGSVRDQGRYQEAEELYRRALALDAELLGRDHPDFAIDLANLGHAVRGQGRKDEALELYRQAIDIFRERLGPDHPYTGMTQGHLDALLREME